MDKPLGDCLDDALDTGQLTEHTFTQISVVLKFTLQPRENLIIGYILYILDPSGFTKLLHRTIRAVKLPSIFYLILKLNSGLFLDKGRLGTHTMSDPILTVLLESVIVVYVRR